MPGETVAEGVGAAWQRNREAVCGQLVEKLPKSVCQYLTAPWPHPRFFLNTVEGCTRGENDILFRRVRPTTEETSSSSNRQNRREAVTQNHGPRLDSRGRQVT